MDRFVVRCAANPVEPDWSAIFGVIEIEASSNDTTNTPPEKMTTLTDVEVAEILMELDRKNLLKQGTEMEIYNLKERAVRRKTRRGILFPTTRRSQFDVEAVADAERLREAEEMLVENEISSERLREIADGMGGWVERMHVLNLER